MKKRTLFTKEVSYQSLTGEIELIHQFGFYAEVESTDDWIGMGNKVYTLTAISWEQVDTDEE